MRSSPSQALIQAFERQDTEQIVKLFDLLPYAAAQQLRQCCDFLRAQFCWVQHKGFIYANEYLSDRPADGTQRLIFPIIEVMGYNCDLYYLTNTLCDLFSMGPAREQQIKDLVTDPETAAFWKALDLRETPTKYIFTGDETRNRWNMLSLDPTTEPRSQERNLFAEGEREFNGFKTTFIYMIQDGFSWAASYHYFAAMTIPEHIPVLNLTQPLPCFTP